MNLSGLPIVLFLLLPGFLTINVAFLIGNFRRLSAFHGSAWSLLTSLVLIASAYPAYISLANPPPGQGHWPSLSQILVNPSLVPGSVWFLLYVVALFVGVLVGVADRIGYLQGISLKLGIDLRKRGDIWSSQFRDAGDVQVYLKDGTLLSGWPEYYSADRSQPGPELYLTNARIWSIETTEWLDIKGVRGILLHGDEITRVEFLSALDEEDRDESDKETVR